MRPLRVAASDESHALLPNVHDILEALGIQQCLLRMILSTSSLHLHMFQMRPHRHMPPQPPIRCRPTAPYLRHEAEGSARKEP